MSRSSDPFNLPCEIQTTPRSPPRGMDPWTSVSCEPVTLHRWTGSSVAAGHAADAARQRIPRVDEARRGCRVRRTSLGRSTRDAGRENRIALTRSSLRPRHGRACTHQELDLVPSSRAASRTHTWTRAKRVNGGCVVRRRGQWNSGMPPGVMANGRRRSATRAACPATRWVRIRRRAVRTGDDRRPGGSPRPDRRHDKRRAAESVCLCLARGGCVGVD